MIETTVGSISIINCNTMLHTEHYASPLNLIKHLAHKCFAKHHNTNILLLNTNHIYIKTLYHNKMHTIQYIWDKPYVISFSNIGGTRAAQTPSDVIIYTPTKRNFKQLISE